MTNAERDFPHMSEQTAPGTLSEAATTDNDILIALNKLDAEDDDHWTTTGKPAMEAVNALLPAAITRARLDEVAPNFSRPEASADNVAGANTDGAGAVSGDEDTQADVSQQFILAPMKTEGGKLGTGDPLDPPDVSGLPAPGSLQPGVKDVSPAFRQIAEDRIAALEADVAYLRKQFGWPTKDE